MVRSYVQIMHNKFYHDLTVDINNSPMVWFRHQVSLSTSNELQTSQTSASHQYCQIPASSQPSSCWDVSLRRRTPQMAACSSYPQTSSDRICSEPPANMSSPTLSFSQQVSCHQDRYSSSLQIPGRHAEHQVTLRTT